METAATTLTDLVKGAKAPSSVNDEWEIFRKDVANSIWAIKNVELQRYVKFATQSSAIFQTTQQANQPLQAIQPQQASQGAQGSSPYICFNTFQDNGATYHTL